MVNSTFVMVICTLPAFLNATLKGQSYHKTNPPSPATQGCNGFYLSSATNAFSETDQTEDLKAIDVPTLVTQGDDDQIVPYKDAVLLQAKLIKNSTLKVYPGYPHGMLSVHADVINPDLLAFVKS
jgi:pimeloyl-ACP methyl ester carboxylesterase